MCRVPHPFTKNGEADAHPKRTFANMEAIYRKADDLYEEAIQLQH